MSPCLLVEYTVGVQGDRASTVKVTFWECKGDG